ncbi:MAG: ABC transporter ATP-binding protein [Longimicrobiales bacterium]
MNQLVLRGVTKRYGGARRPAVDEVSLSVEAGEIVSLVGESGSGKTTLLRMIAGLETPSAGEIEIGGRIMYDARTEVAPERRGVGIVFQDYALFPHLDVLANVAFGLQAWPRRERAVRAREILALVGLQGVDRRRPHELSGGQQQRVALARALAPRPAILLLDEPFSNLDAALKDQVREEIAEILRTTGTTALFVVHDTADALSVADRVAILRAGRLLQVDTPRGIYACPSNEYIARFFGKTNILTGRTVPGGFETAVGFLPAPHAPAGAEEIVVCVRPDALEVVAEGQGTIVGTVRSARFVGNRCEVRLFVPRPHGHHQALWLFTPPDRAPEPGHTIHLRPAAHGVQVLGVPRS